LGRFHFKRPDKVYLKKVLENDKMSEANCFVLLLQLSKAADHFSNPSGITKLNQKVRLFLFTSIHQKKFRWGSNEGWWFETGGA
jgi:hypothetical protein